MEQKIAMPSVFPIVKMLSIYLQSIWVQAKVLEKEDK